MTEIYKSFIVVHVI